MKKGKVIGIIALLFVLVFGSTLTVNAANKKESFTSDNLVYQIIKNPSNNKLGEVLIISYKNKKSNNPLEIPKNVSHEGKTYNVTSIANKTFQNSNFSDLKLPDTLKELYTKSFKNCKNLTSIEIPDGIKLYGQVFSGCTSLEKVKLPKSLTWIPGGLFQDCKSLKKVNIPDKVTIIDAYAFHNCSSLEKIVLPDTVKTIGQDAFSGCKALQEINMPINVTYIGSNAFEECDNLTATIPKYSILENELFRNGINYNYSNETYFDIEPIEAYSPSHGVLYYKVTNTRKTTFYNLQASYSLFDSNNIQVSGGELNITPILKSGESVIIALNTKNKEYSDLKLRFGSSSIKYKSKNEYITATMGKNVAESNSSLNRYNITINSTSNLIDYVMVTVILYKENKVVSIENEHFSNVYKGSQIGLLELVKEIDFDNYEIKIDAYNNN